MPRRKVIAGEASEPKSPLLSSVTSGHPAEVFSSGTVTLSEADQERIVAQVEFERHIRAATADEKKKERWVNSSFGLLIIGSLITGILVPIFQFTQKALETRRASRYEAVTFKVGVLRDTLRDLAVASSFNDQTYLQLSQLSQALPQDTEDQYRRFLDAITEIQAKRFQHNAKLLVAPIYFKDRSRFEATLTRYFSTSSLYAADITAIGRASRAAPDDVTRLRQAADEHQMQMNQLYDDLEQQTKEQLGELEDERDSFW